MHLWVWVANLCLLPWQVSGLVATKPGLRNFRAFTAFLDPTQRCGVSLQQAPHYNNPTGKVSLKTVLKFWLGEILPVVPLRGTKPYYLNIC